MLNRFPESKWSNPRPHPLNVCALCITTCTTFLHLNLGTLHSQFLPLNCSTYDSFTYLLQINKPIGDPQMLDYEWGNPPAIMFTGTVDDASSQPDHQTRHIFDQYSQISSFNETTNTQYLDPNDFLYHAHNPNNHYLYNPTQTHPQFASVYDTRAYTGYCAYPPSPSPFLSIEPEGSGSSGPAGYVLMPKAEPAACSIDFANNRIGLNLGGRTYFSSAEDDFVNPLYCRSGPALDAAIVRSPRCQAEGCNADLTHAKHYHRRHKVCEFHSKASTVITAGLTQRFCQQCSRFHLLSEFDNGKRSCRRRLADHNRRRRKSSQSQDHSKSLITVTSTQSSSSEITSRYEMDSRG